jgi:hypothetical protein
MSLTSLYFNNTNTILDNNVNNGRVTMIDNPSTDIIFKMQECTTTKNTATEYKNAVANIEETNVLAQAFFSAENIQIIQNGLRAGVYQLSNKTHIITQQNTDVLKVIMRSIYLQYTDHKPDVTAEITYLNRLVLEYAVPNVYSGVLGHIKYTEDISTLIQPLDLPRSTDRDYKQLELKPWV